MQSTCFSKMGSKSQNCQGQHFLTMFLTCSVSLEGLEGLKKKLGTNV